jgi:hypothetical protein
MNSPDLPPPRTYKDVPLVPAVDPEDLKRVWNLKPPWTRDSHKDACSPGADVEAVVKRRHMIGTLVTFKLLAPWTRDGTLEDGVFRLAATFPLHEHQSLDYQIPGDELWGFDPNAFAQRLVEETGVAHVWEPVATKVSEGGRGYSLVSASIRGAVPDLDREARFKTRQLLWNIWRRFSGIESANMLQEREHLSVVSVLFEDFLMANLELVQRVVEEFRQGQHVEKDLLMEIERRAIQR